MDSHLAGGEREYSNRRNGHMSKQVQISLGEVTINIPRDRDGVYIYRNFGNCNNKSVLLTLYYQSYKEKVTVIEPN